MKRYNAATGRLTILFKNNSKDENAEGDGNDFGFPGSRTNLQLVRQ